MKKLLILSSLFLSLVGCGNVNRVQNTCLKEKTIYFSKKKNIKKKKVFLIIKKKIHYTKIKYIKIIKYI